MTLTVGNSQATTQTSNSTQGVTVPQGTTGVQTTSTTAYSKYYCYVVVRFDLSVKLSIYCKTIMRNCSEQM